MISWRMTFLNWFIAASQDLDTLGHTASDLPTTCWSRLGIWELVLWNPWVNEVMKGTFHAWVEWVEATLSTWGNGWFNESLGSVTVGVPLFSTVQLGVISRFDRRAWWCSHEDRALTLWPDCWIAWSRILRVCGWVDEVFNLTFTFGLGIITR